MKLDLNNWNGRVLVCAHCDDELLNCSSILQGSLVVIVTNGDLGRPIDCNMSVEEYAKERLAESTRVAARYDVAHLVLLEYSEVELNAGNPKILEKINNLLEYCNPETIYIHHWNSQHPGHKVLGQWALNNWADKYFTLYFCDQHHAPKENPVIGVSLGDEQWKKKLENILSFHTQSNWLPQHVMTNVGHFKEEGFWR